ncbi:hypothetical protein ACFFQF_03470 [Haladaptatus pallidirubidus]|uniref:DUF7344 domain-containing protein n=1 Tax=Haladaptatus pallidirubidus TaxID=1008152 RepID=A0AAV3UKF0_9EURY|nr:hypothetical protein [Haladaptatus pallidirubidus]
MKLTEPETEQELDESQIHNVLRNDRRREAIRYLRESGGSLTVDDLAEHIATLETDETPAPRKVRKSVYVSLHQTHLPKLDDLGIVEYDQRSKELTLEDRVREVEVYMEVVPQHDVSWATYYLGLGLLEAIVLLAAQFELFSVQMLDFQFWTWFFLTFLVVSASYHVYREQEKTLF